jgi:hypothetical protein
MRERAVLGVRAHAEVHVSPRLVGAPVALQRGDEVDDRADGLRRERLRVRSAEPESVGVGHVRVGHLARELGARNAERPRGVVDLVVDVRDVDDQLRRVALMRQEPPEQGKDDERTRIADVDAVVDRRPAGVDPDGLAGRGAELAQLSGGGVLDPHGRPRG